MEHQKNPINNNPNNTNQAENSASTSSIKPAISEQELTRKKIEYKEKYKNYSEQFIYEKINREQYQTYLLNLWENYKNILGGGAVLRMLENQVDTELDLDYETDSEEGEWEEEKEKELAVYTGNGQAVIKAEISQELTAIKEDFENIKISETTEARIDYKINKEVDRMKSTWTGENTFANTLGLVPVIGNIVGPWHAAEHSANLEKSIKKQAKTTFPEIVKKLVNEATADLEKQKNKAVKKLGTLIEARDFEVVKAKEVIQALETLLLEKEEKNKDLAAEIKKLLEAITEKENELADFQQRKIEVEKSTRIRLAEILKKPIKAVMKDGESKVVELEKEIAEIGLAAKILDESLQNERLQLENARKEIERNKDTIIRKENELERERKIFLNRQSELTAQIRQWEERYNKMKADWDAEEERETDLEAKNKNLKIDKNTLENKVRELEETIKGLQPSWSYQMAEKFGIIKLKNIAVNTAVIVGLIAIIYIASLVLKYIAKPAWLNLAGFFPKSKKRKVITVEAEQEEEEEAEEEIFEVEAKPVKNFSRLNSPKKTAKSKGKSKSKTK